MKRAILFSLKFITILLFIGILFAYAMFQGGFVSWFLFFGSLPIFLYMALLLLYPISNIKIERIIKQNIIEAGNDVKIEIIFKRNPLFPLYYCIIEDIMPDTIGYRDTKQKKFTYLSKPDSLKEKQGAKKVIFPWLKRKFSFVYTLKYVPRGEHVLNQIRIVIGDFTGTVKKEKIFNVENKLQVFPAKRKVTLHKTAASFEEGVSNSLNRTINNTTVVAGVRNYAPGDRVAWIDWKASAKKNEMMTKEFEQEKSQDMLLLFDATSYENMNWLAFEGAVELGNALISSLHGEAARLVFTSFGANRETFSINHDFSNNQNVIKFLTKIKPQASLPFARALKQEVGLLQRGYSLMIITTNFTRELYDVLLELKLKSPRVVLFLVKDLKSVTGEEQDLFKRLKNYGIMINIITEEKLIHQSFEVNA